MSYGIYSLNSPILISDAAIVRNFEGRHDVLVIARGSLLQFYSLSDGFTLRYEYRLFGDIARIIPLKHPSDSQANILLILRDLRYSIIRFYTSNNSIKTVQSGNIESSTGVSLDPPFRVAVSPVALLLQVHQQVLQYFQINPSSQLGPPVNYSIPAKYIIDFDFMNSGELVKFAVLSEDFGQTTKLQIFDVDPTTSRSTNHKDQIQAAMKNDSYAIKVIDSSSLIVFKTDAAIKVILNSSTNPKQRSSSIYTSDPLIKFARMDQNHFIAADNGNNLYSINLKDLDQVELFRIGSINTPIALLPYDNKHLISISQSGESFRIELVGDVNHMKSKTTTLMTNCSSVKKIIDVNSSEFIGICGNGFSHIIRQSLILEEFAQVPIMGVKDVWIFNNDFVITINEKTHLFSLDDDGVTPIQNEDLITNQPTIAFKQVSSTDFIQITPTKVLISSIKSCKDYSSIHQASISESKIGLIVSDGQTDFIAVLDFEMEEILNNEAPIPIEEIAVNDQYVAVSSWPESQIVILSIESGEAIKTIEKVNCIGMTFSPDYLIVAETRDHCLFYPLKAFEPPEDGSKRDTSFTSLHCNGMHYTIIPFGDGTTNDVIVAGERPVLIQNLTVKEIEYSGFKGGACSEDKIVLIHDDSISFCHPSGYAMTVHEDKSSVNVIDTIQIVNNSKENESRLNFIVASQDEKGYSLSVVEHPLSTIHPTITKPNDKPYIGMSSISCNGMKFVAVIFGDHLILYEVSDELLLERSNLQLEKVPFQITSFNSKFIVAFTEEFQLFELDFVSHSNIMLKNITKMLTQGSTSCISNDDEFVAVCDELQSLVLYYYDDTSNKFSEHARNCIDFGLSICRVSIDDYFSVDHAGNFFQMQISESKNIESSDLEICSCYALGESATAMLVFGENESDEKPTKESEEKQTKESEEKPTKDSDEKPLKVQEDKQTKVLIGTQSAQYIEVISFKPSDEFVALYNEIERNVQSLGRLSSFSHRAVLVDNFMLPCPTMYNFDLIKMFLELETEQQNIIVEAAKLPLEQAIEISEQIMQMV